MVFIATRCAVIAKSRPGGVARSFGSNPAKGGLRHSRQPAWHACRAMIALALYDEMSRDL